MEGPSLLQMIEFDNMEVQLTKGNILFANWIGLIKTAGLKCIFLKLVTCNKKTKTYQVPLTHGYVTGTRIGLPKQPLSKSLMHFITSLILDPYFYFWIAFLLRVT